MPSAFLAAVTPEPVLEIFEENWPAAQVFLRMSRQWRVGPTGRLLALDYTALAHVMNWMQIADPADTWRRVCVIEAKALKLLERDRGH